MADKGTTETETPVVAAAPQPASEVKKSDRDIGDWKYSPWSGLDRWVNPKSREESFDEKYVKRSAGKK